MVAASKDEQPEIVALQSERKYQLMLMVKDKDERAPDHIPVEIWAQGEEGGPQYKIARRAMNNDEDVQTLREIVEAKSRALLYMAHEEEPGIVAQIMCVVEQGEIDDSEAWKQDTAYVGLYLGTVVRTRASRVHPDNLFDEGVDHFQAITSGKLMEPIEQVLKEL